MAKKRKNRRIKKTKYLSLRLQFSSEKQALNSNDDSIPTTSGHLQQLDLLSNDHGHDDSMEYLLSASDGGATTLTGLLDSADAVDEDETDELSASASVTYASEAMKLVRTALRSKERESSSEERYVRYSEVVDDQRRDHNHEHEEVSSRVGVGGGEWYNNKKKNEKTSTVVMRRLCLKLDYQEILNAWSDKGDLYIHSDFPQTVPDIIDITHHFSSHHPIDPIPNGGGLWNVPEKIGGSKLFKTEEEEEIAVPLLGGKVRVGDDEDHRPEERKCQRNASVLRYKEKRRNRLFSKTIRYQVRKENAQKRPRVKGRFVKRS